MLQMSIPQFQDLIRLVWDRFQAARGHKDYKVAEVVRKGHSVIENIKESLIRGTISKGD
jgi:hypothetical protein